MPTPLALFDLDGTLVDRQMAYGDAIAALCRAHGFDEATERWLRLELADRANLANFAELCAVFQLAVPAQQLWQEYTGFVAAAVTCRPEAVQGLAQLRTAGWTIGIITNGASDIQRRKITESGLADLVDGIAVSGDLEIRKPDERLFELAAARCGHDLAEGGWIIGDNPITDIDGGRRAGLRTIWLRGRPWPTGLATADHTVDTAAEAIPILLNETSE
ncbi:HAD family hydrolase [Streptomyces sp. NPDC051561]|uniref:HAD family hydrolase n=1 Tax=Streptomyces sp. NPDC051561 TaxID=3365658 RepID=UPI00379AB658